MLPMHFQYDMTRANMKQVYFKDHHRTHLVTSSLFVGGGTDPGKEFLQYTEMLDMDITFQSTPFLEAMAALGTKTQALVRVIPNLLKPLSEHSTGINAFRELTGHITPEG